jgi:TonB family protein
VFGSLDRTAEAERKSRTPLFAAIAVAAAVLVGFAVWKLTQRQTPPPPVHVAVTPSPAAAAVPTAVPAVMLTPTAPALDPKAVEAEVQRQLAAKRKEMEKAAAAAAPKKTAAAALAAAEPEPTLAPPTALPTPVPTARPEPTAVPTEPPLATLALKEADLQRGDLVGPGPGVVEPALVAPPRVVYPPIARQQHVGGKVVILVLVDENGQVTSARLQQGLEGQNAVNDAVMAGVKSAKFRPATKNGTPVKMWRPVIVQVTP